MRIAEAANLTKLTAHTLRFYESEGLVIPGRRGTIRDYSAEDIDRLDTIAQLREIGFSIPQIRELIQLDGLVGELGSLDEVELDAVGEVERILQTSITELESRMEFLQRNLTKLRDMRRKAAWLLEHGGTYDEPGLDRKRDDRHLRGANTDRGDS